MKDPRKNTSRYYDIVQHPVDDIPFYLERIRQLDAREVLELGCGTGRVFVPLAGVCEKLVGVDYSREMLDRCEEKLGGRDANAKTLLGDITRFESGDTSAWSAVVQ